MEMFWAIVLFAVGLVLLIKGGDWFVDGATGIAERFHVPELLIGATVVSIGTTLPEVMVSATSAFQGLGGMSYGNAIGSVICNTALIAALTVAIRPPKISVGTFRTPVYFFFGAAVFYAAVAYALRRFDRWVGVVLLCGFLIYMFFTVRQALREKEVPAEADAAEKAEDGKKPRGIRWDLGLLIVGAALIAVGAKLLVDKGTFIAEKLGVPDTVIALTFVALGTSLPELVTAVTSLIKGHGALSLGNIIGANLFNLVLVSGMSVTINPFDLPAEKTIGTLNASLVVDLPVMFLVMGILCLPALIRGKLSKWQGYALLAIYAAFCVFQFIN